MNCEEIVKILGTVRSWHNVMTMSS